MDLAVIIKCQGYGNIALDDLQLLHHFKTLTDDDYARGRNLLLERGFKFPFSVWVSPENTNYTVDGHQRIAILKRMRDEGVTLPSAFPFNLVTADSKEDAAKDIIASETVFAAIDPGEFTSFLEDYAIQWETVEDWANIPDLASDDEKKSDGGSKKEKEITCPQCQTVIKL